ncbi:5-deoxy-glucuronate isomerase [Paenibacillus apiarius]|uniref:5-deoxy-glucuronate isomerase n=1 Tax=Paenibacillus apiarius TaxID=46240 RepID=A0ABT4DZS1_9BACL|nr:5-deoxy-glucuronate isomerase [Paenibacillus apiarius]MCY9515189.1 5-deoxy-glucuronate isomerase [Paenibacillus apiarius]MCY9522710.1 5-deoxy-glucuronate isomerase [Paenibacillus apiarius]MCY9552930.1 5-deoxy-glucuronate isomerase [Paenibacillus apiarius]MCY9557653.1 5-deoxy-glucuronate isomerase [Paenibacillus apiarius]MCY9681892.1 5-deoxy-glucuronate isomerase [Paenibacillus apiarius]
MSKLIVKPAPRDEEGNVLSVTPQSAGWQYVGFELYSLRPGETLQRVTKDREVCLVLLSGKAKVDTGKQSFGVLGHRMSVFDRIPPYSVYVPSDDRYSVQAETALELAVCSAPGRGTYPARVIAPEDVGVETRGSGSIERQIHNILPEQKDADSLLVVEVFTPAGHWSSYPPHKHDRDNLPEESYLEETYYHEVNPGQGFVMQRVYNDDRSLDETMAVPHRHVVLVPEGYHPVSAPPGYDSYYLNVMAGPQRTWKFHNDPDHEWLFTK